MKRIIGKKKETMCISNQCMDAITALLRDIQFKKHKLIDITKRMLK